jgi:hypothetical protein
MFERSNNCTLARMIRQRLTAVPRKLERQKILAVGLRDPALLASFGDGQLSLPFGELGLVGDPDASSLRAPYNQLRDQIMNAEGRGDGFVEEFCRHVERMRGLVQIVDNDGAGFKRHDGNLSYSPFVHPWSKDKSWG